MSRCEYIDYNDVRCDREAIEGSRYCWLHQNYIGVPDDVILFIQQMRDDQLRPTEDFAIDQTKLDLIDPKISPHIRRVGYDEFVSTLGLAITKFLQTRDTSYAVYVPSNCLGWWIAQTALRITWEHRLLMPSQILKNEDTTDLDVVYYTDGIFGMLEVPIPEGSTVVTAYASSQMHIPDVSLPIVGEVVLTLREQTGILLDVPLIYFQHGVAPPIFNDWLNAGSLIEGCVGQCEWFQPFCF